jgi:aminopeptidase
MQDPRTDRLARLIVEYSTHIQRGDRVLIEGETAAEPFIRSLFEHVLRAGGHPHLLVSLSGIITETGLDESFLTWASDDQLDYPATFFEHAYENFESRIRIYSSSNTRSLTRMDGEKLARRRRALAGILKSQMRRGAAGELHWITTLFPTQGHAQDADMSLVDFEDFVYGACHVDEAVQDPVADWRAVQEKQQRLVDALNGRDHVTVKGPNVDLQLSVKDRTFLNACGEHNMPDGEIFTGPVESSAQGWVRFSYPAIYGGNEVDGVELRFKDGRVVEAHAEKNESFLLKTLETDPGARYLGEFAFGLNYGIRQHIKQILFDEKIGGTMHLALGAGYPDTGNTNQSAVHWDMICDMKNDSEVTVDGETVYRDGQFVID